MNYSTLYKYVNMKEKIWSMDATEFAARYKGLRNVYDETRVVHTQTLWLEFQVSDCSHESEHQKEWADQENVFDHVPSIGIPPLRRSIRYLLFVTVSGYLNGIARKK
jgi:hypothetical protein